MAQTRERYTRLSMVVTSKTNEEDHSGGSRNGRKGHYIVDNKLDVS